MPQQTRKGQCICGAVQFEAKPLKSTFGACHCQTCSGWTSSSFVSTPCKVKGIDEHPSVKFYQSSSWGSRGFCVECGATLFWKEKDSDEVEVSISAFEDVSDLKFENEIFVDEKASWVPMSEMTKKMTGNEAMAYFSKQQDEG